MIRMNINIAIVSMVKNKIDSKIPVSGLCYNDSVQQSSTFNLLLSARNVKERFDWDEYKQSQILGAFYWLACFTELPGGILAHHYGAKRIFGANIFCVVLCFLIPFASYADYRLLILIRVLQGFVSGAAWSSVNCLVANWIPPHERSKFMSSYLGSSFGVAVTYFVSGYVIDCLGWEYVFYLTGIVGVIWYVLWCVFVYETPEKHPWISKEEQSYISHCLKENVTKEKLPVPWTRILRSTPFWLATLAQFGSAWGMYTLITHTPTYLKTIHGLDIKMTGAFCGLPYLTRFIFSYFYGGFSDRLIRKKVFSVSVVRKLATLLCAVIKGLFVLWLAFVGCDTTLAVILILISVTVQGAVTSGPIVGMLDISPNYSAVLQGLCGIISSSPGFFSPLIVGILTENNQTSDQWQKVFLITAAILFSTGVLYIAFGTSELADWNNNTNISSNSSKRESVQGEHLKDFVKNKHAE